MLETNQDFSPRNVISWHRRASSYLFKQEYNVICYKEEFFLSVVSELLYLQEVVIK